MYGVAGSPGDEPTRECFTGLVNGMDGIGFWRVSVHRERSSRLAASSKACARCCVPISCWCVLAQLACPRFTVRLACVPRSHYIVRVLGMHPRFTLRLACVPRSLYDSGSHYVRVLGTSRSLPRTFGTTQRSTSACQTSCRRLPDCSFARICRVSYLRGSMQNVVMNLMIGEGPREVGKRMFLCFQVHQRKAWSAGP